MAIASLVLGICGLFGWCIPCAGLPMGIVGLILGIKGLQSENRGMAIAGIVLCSLTLVGVLRTDYEESGFTVGQALGDVTDPASVERLAEELRHLPRALRGFRDGLREAERADRQHDSLAGDQLLESVERIGGQQPAGVDLGGEIG